MLMYILNKIVGAFANPVYLGAIGCFLGLMLTICHKQTTARLVFVVSVFWVWFWAMPFASRLVGVPLERPYLVDDRMPELECCPMADAIELHGGSMAVATNVCSRGEMWGSADRVWLAARLWKEGKAPVIYVTGGYVELTTSGLLQDLGVPTNAVVYAEEPRNTEEEARFIAESMKREKSGGECNRRTNVLVVTSAWHMRRTMLMYQKYAPEIEAIPAPCDFENTVRCTEPIGIVDFIPDPWALAMNCVSVHEWVGILGYRLFR